MATTLETWFRTTLTRKFSPADTDMYVKTLPTKSAGRIYLKNGAQEEWVRFTGKSSSPNKLTWCVRQLSKTADPATSWWDGYTWIAWTPIKLVSMHDQLIDRQQAVDLDSTLDVGDDITIADTKKLQFVDTATYIYKDASNDLVFKDPNSSEISLSSLSSLSGSNDKVKISSNDTTENFLVNKVTWWDGITVTETNNWSNETLDIDIDTTDTNIFSSTKSAGKVPLLNGSWEIDNLLSTAIPLKASDAEVIAWTNNTKFVTPAWLVLVKAQHKIFTGTISFDDSALSNITLTHNFWYLPSFIDAYLWQQNAHLSKGLGTTSTPECAWFATYDWSTIVNKCYDPITPLFRDNLFFYNDWAWDYSARTVTAITTSTITITHSYSGTFSLMTRNYLIVVS